MSVKIINAIKKINPNAVVSVGFENVNGDSNNLNDVSLTWHDGTTPISKADIEAKMNEMANEPEQSNYAQARKNAYPEIGDQLDMLWHTMDKNNELQHKFYDFYQTIKKVKVAYPKK